MHSFLERHRFEGAHVAPQGLLRVRTMAEPRKVPRDPPTVKSKPLLILARNLLDMEIAVAFLQLLQAPYGFLIVCHIGIG